MGKTIYLNYAADAQPKPPAVIEEMTRFLQTNNDPHTSRSLLGLEEAGSLLEARERIAQLFNAPDAAHVAFTSGITLSLNMILNGLLKPGDHVITTSVEHNAVSRPLHLLQQNQKVSVTILPCGPDGTLDPDLVAEAILPNTKALIMTHASNVLGTVLPVKACFEIGKRRGLITILDSAQTAGFLPIDMQELSIDVVAFTGHKGLLGLSGVGGFALSTEAAQRIDPWLVGGTGSRSHELEQPRFLPDKFEAGTQNMLGVVSMSSGIDWLQKQGVATLRQHQQQRTKQFIQGLHALPVSVLGNHDQQLGVPVVSLTTPQLSPGQLAQRLYDDYGIITRAGLHCAPWAHQTAGTSNTGAVRFSFGWATTTQEIDDTIVAIKTILTK